MRSWFADRRRLRRALGAGGRFIRPGWLQAHRIGPTTTAYVVLACVLGIAGEAIFGPLSGATARVSSASAVSILSAIAAGMMAFTAIVFSLLFVAVQIGGTAYSPRLVGVMARHARLGHVLGIFTGTFVYALLAIARVDIAGRTGVSSAVLMLAGLWLLASVGAMVGLAPRTRHLVIGELLAELERSATVASIRVYQPSEPEGPSTAISQPPPVASAIRYHGPPRYLVGFDTKLLVRTAVQADAMLVIYPAIGDAVIAGDHLVGIAGEPERIPARLLRKALWLERERTLDNDPSYAIRLLVDIAIRALSPAINDPTTAVSVLDEIDGILRVLGERRLEDNQITDERGAVRVVREVATWDDFLTLALTEIHYYGRGSFQVQRRLARLSRDLLAVLPADRHPAIEQFRRWRGASMAPALDDPKVWTDPSACDRQGLGHQPPQLH